MFYRSVARTTVKRAIMPRVRESTWTTSGAQGEDEPGDDGEWIS